MSFTFSTGHEYPEQFNIYVDYFDPHPNYVYGGMRAYRHHYNHEGGSQNHGAANSNVIPSVKEMHSYQHFKLDADFVNVLFLCLGEALLARRLQGDAVRALIEDIDSLRMLRNAIAHKSGVIDGRSEAQNLKNIEKLKRLRGVYIYGGNSVFVSQEGIDHILGICDRFRKVYTEHFIK